MGTTIEAIREELEKADKPLTPKQISMRVFGKNRSLSQQLHSLITFNIVEKVGRGLYAKK